MHRLVFVLLLSIIISLGCGVERADDDLYFYTDDAGQEVHVVVDYFSDTGEDGGLVEDTEERTCCKVCWDGKACGDTCIDESYVCHTGQGCACNPL